MKIPSGDENSRDRDRWFANTNRIRFNFPITDDISDWWKEQMFDPFGLTPEGLAERFTTSWPNDRQIEFLTIDPRRPEVEFAVRGSLGDTNIWLVDRSIDMGGSAVEARRMDVADDWQFHGVGRRLMRDTVEAAIFLGLERIRLDADDVGRYAWVKMGFLPDKGSWRSIRDACLRMLPQFNSMLEPSRLQEIFHILMSADPLTIRLIADLHDPVTSPRLRRPGSLEPQVVPLGKAMLLGDCPLWSGELDLRDPTSMSLMKDYVDAKR